jgi:hypothetical protein
MEKEFVPYELALRLGSLGFDEPCIAWYVSKSYGLEYGKVIKPDLIKEAVLAPLFSQAFRWFDYSTEWSGFIVPSSEEGCFDWWIQNYTDPQLSIESDEWYRGREEAELACLEKLIEIVEQK